ncbi:hypothetical protein G4D82_12295 [Flavobacterium sp. CYK-4]|uniref:hypothetical protein n=1 Tax=Flavobacterium lotistagni TaxID=2709660 RepID=UPI00140BFA9D|nr:hypothetical protein [Flavobacterium lotistagni]NHM08006.1 hypothetical protein [Flavobacterium lotistagni]
MKEASELLFSFLTSQSVFTDVVGQLNGVWKLYPIAADSDVPEPFATYRIREQSGATKDASSYLVSLGVFFSPEQYDECVAFCDAITPIIRGHRDFEWITSEPDIDDEDGSFVSIINFKITI